MEYAAINPVDWKMRNGVMKIVTGRQFPREMSMDFSGVVLAVGEGVARFKPDDAVFGLARFKECGALAEAVITTEENLRGLDVVAAPVSVTDCCGRRERASPHSFGRRSTPATAR